MNFVYIGKGRITHLERKVIVYYSGGKTTVGVGGQQEKNIKDVYMIEYYNNFYIHKCEKNLINNVYILIMKYNASL